MKYYTASRIHNGIHFEKEPKILAFDEDNTFVQFLDIDAVSADQCTHFPGILMPGMVNAHCHLELSHTKGSIPENTGLVGFLGEVVQVRAASEEAKQSAIKAAAEQLVASGCIALGDIANGVDSLPIRETLPLHIHTFVESMGFVPAGAQQRFNFSEQVYHQFAAQANNGEYYRRQSIVPHAPYSVSEDLFSLINQFQPSSLLSIHNQECAAENEYFDTKTGKMQELYQRLNIDDAWFKAHGQHSLPVYINYLDKAHQLLLVHNTFMDEQDLLILKQSQRKVSICLCPNANMYIERSLPDVPTFAASGINICLGTDSLASNHQLNVYEEVLLLQAHFPTLEEEQLLSWASAGGAIALEMEDILGRFLNGLKPGLVHIHEKKSSRIL